MTDQPAESPVPDDSRDEPVPTPEEIAEELDAVAEEHEALEEERRYPSTIGGAFYLLVLATAAVGIAIVWSGDWRLGIRCLAGALCFAALLRLVLPARDAGMLAVRQPVLRRAAARRGRCRDLLPRDDHPRTNRPAQISPSSLTASRSSASSATEASIRPREKSSISRPWTISQSPSLEVTGNDETRPSGTP